MGNSMKTAPILWSDNKSTYEMDKMPKSTTIFNLNEDIQSLKAYIIDLEREAIKGGLKSR